MLFEKKKNITRIKRRGAGLRLKLAAFTTGLVILVVMMVSAPLYLFMTSTQAQTLLRGLWNRSAVLLDGIAANAKSYLPAQNILELGFLPAQSSAVPEARYLTISGFGSNTTDFTVWASNDPDLENKINTASFEPGISVLTDELSPLIPDLRAKLDQEARAAVSGLAENIANLTREGVSLALRSDAAGRNRLADIQVSARSLETRLNESLAEIGKNIGSVPAFPRKTIHSRDPRFYILYKPVMFRQGQEQSYFRGLVRLEISIDSIYTEIAAGQRKLLGIILFIALAAVILGAAGALALSGLILRPVALLVRHVETIRDTNDKTALQGLAINLKSRDELAVLGGTINSMTEGLVKAALASRDLSIGKEIQKKFIPLELDHEGNKLSSGSRDTPALSFFGYYEASEGVSGDYFDYMELAGGRYYAVIKCDVAGKGIPAALIMIQVATMFINHFKQWRADEKGLRIESVVYQINDFIETLGFEGRFAAFTLCLVDTATGLVRFCNAGDNIVHLYSAAAGCLQTITLPQTPAAGVLSNSLIESSGGYTVQTLQIGHGDILFLYTDGIEEAKRRFRSPDFREITCTEGTRDSPHGNHSSGQSNEALGARRVTDIINAVMNRQTYNLTRYHNPEGYGQELTFDFRRASGAAAESVLALVAAEKLFRIYRGPASNGQVAVDKKIDAFLRKYFSQYRLYASDARSLSGDENSVYYSGLQEDPQYDDLAILAIKRK